MQTEKSRAVPTLQVGPRLELYPVRGDVHCVRSFAEAHASVLADHERRFLAANRDCLAAPTVELSTPLARSGLPPIDGPRLPALRRGARSAYISSLGLKLKGCRPEPSSFPSWSVDDGRRPVVTTIPFGVLQAEGVMRELLGSCFAACHGLSLATVPIAVFEYADAHGDGRFCLVSSGDDAQRAEARIDCDGLTLHDVVRLHRVGRLRGREARLRGIDATVFIARKADALARLHVAGGRRGVLNSNIGNDVLAGDAFAGLCDFDTFRLQLVPDGASDSALADFVFTALIEVLKSSLPFIDFCADGTPSGLAHYYRTRSSLYRAYRDRFACAAAARRWNAASVERHARNTLESSIATELIRELVPNAETMSQFTLDGWYVPHN
jgi:hypothetical protein